MTRVFAPLNINLVWDMNTNLRVRRNKAFSEHDTSKFSENNAWRKLTRVPGTDILNIWVVNTIDVNDDGFSTVSGVRVSSQLVNTLNLLDITD